MANLHSFSFGSPTQMPSPVDEIKNAIDERLDTYRQENAIESERLESTLNSIQSSIGQQETAITGIQEQVIDIQTGMKQQTVLLTNAGVAISGTFLVLAILLLAFMISTRRTMKKQAVQTSDLLSNSMEGKKVALEMKEETIRMLKEAYMLQKRALTLPERSSPKSIDEKGIDPPPEQPPEPQKPIREKILDALNQCIAEDVKPPWRDAVKERISKCPPLMFLARKDPKGDAYRSVIHRVEDSSYYFGFESESKVYIYPNGSYLYKIDACANEIFEDSEQAFSQNTYVKQCAIASQVDPGLWKIEQKGQINV